MLSDKKYQIIYADPPWNFKTWSQKGEKKSAANHYSIMTMDDIKSLPIYDIAEKDCLLFMWATSPLLPKQIEVMESWGFKYKTIGFVWVKQNKKSPTPFVGLGYYSRANAEYCLIGVKGKPGRPSNKSISQIVSSPVREHSRKPDVVYNNIEKMYPGRSKIELFSRTTKSGWDVWGLETNTFSLEHFSS